MPSNSACASFHQHPCFPPSDPEIPSRWHISCITSNPFFFSQWPLEWGKIKNSFFTNNQYFWDGILCQVGWIPLSRLLHVGQEAEGDLRWDVRTCHLIVKVGYSQRYISHSGCGQAQWNRMGADYLTTWLQNFTYLDEPAWSEKLSRKVWPQVSFEKKR